MSSLHCNGTWELACLPPGKTTFGCRLVYVVKTSPDPDSRVDD